MTKLIIGDIHGRQDWKTIVDQDFDQVIFLGDYVSTHENISEQQQIDNLKDIIQFKKDNIDKVALLRGNHEMDHLKYPWAERCGYFPKVADYMYSIKDEFLRLTQWIYIDEDIETIFSHAGVSQVWMDNSKIKHIYDINTLEPSQLFGFTPTGMWDMCGTSITQPPTWIRPQQLAICNVQGWDQVVGHTPVIKSIVNIKECVKGKRNIWLCDALHLNQYLMINDNEFIVCDYGSKGKETK